MALVLPILGRCFDRQNYGAAFGAVASVSVAGTLLWFLLTARQHVKA